MTWQMVEAYGFGNEAIPSGASPMYALAGLRAALADEQGSRLEQLQAIHAELALLNVGAVRDVPPHTAAAGSVDQALARALAKALLKALGWTFRARAAHVLQHTWGITAKNAWQPGVTRQKLVTLCEGTIFPGLSQINERGPVVGDDLESLWRTCWAMVQQPVCKLSRRTLIHIIQRFSCLGVAVEGSHDDPCRERMRRLVLALERLVEMRYVRKAMKAQRVSGRPWAQMNKALKRQTERVEKALATVEWPQVVKGN